MVELFSGTRHLEILVDLERSDNDTSYLIEKDTQQMDYPLFDYLFSQQEIPSIERGKHGLHVGHQQIKRQKSQFILPTANPILVEERITEKNPDNYAKLKNTFKELGLELSSVLDVEYFESYLDQQQLVKSFFEDVRLEGTQMQKIRQHIKQLKQEEFEYAFGFVTNDNYTIDRLTEVLDENKANKRAFTALLDTEKIHIQFAKIEEQLIPVYFGYGNYDVFTRNLGKKRNKRMSRTDLITQTDSKTLKKALMRSNKETREALCELINDCQKKYYHHFNKHFSYESRLEEFRGDMDSREVDSVLMIPPICRTKSAALIAHHQFSKQELQSFYERRV